MGKVRWLRWALGGATVAVAAGAVALLLAPRPTPADIESVSVGPIADSLADQGYARVREAYVVSAPVAGRLERVDLHVGDQVTAGATVVARIRPAGAELLDPRARARAQAAVAAAEAAVAAARAQQEKLNAEARKADGDLARVRTLAAKGFAAGQALDAADAQAKAARAAVRAATAELVAQRSELASARAALIGPEAATSGLVTVTAPASGAVTRVLQESERIVAMGAPLVEISDRGGLEAAVEFLSQDAVRIREGMAAEVFDWGGPPIPAVVRRVEPQGFTKVSALGVEEQRALVLLQLDGDPAAWKSLAPGYRLWGRVFLRREGRAVKAPLGALVRSGGGWAAYRVVDGRSRLTPITVGAITDREAEVRRGLAPGDKVVVFPSDKVTDGGRVRAN
jgi:HlyD family secretion protein